MAADQQFCLRWNNHQSTLISVFDTLLEKGTLVDCTLAAEGQFMKAHKVVLSACSPYFELLLSQHYDKHPILILKEVKFQELKAIMDYMYRGEVNISQDQLASLLKVAESLQVKGLSEGSGGDEKEVPEPRPEPRKPPAPPQQRTPAPYSNMENRRTPTSHSTPIDAPIDTRPVTPAKISRDQTASPPARKRKKRHPSNEESTSFVSDGFENSMSSELPAQSMPVPSLPPQPIQVASVPVPSKPSTPLTSALEEKIDIKPLKLPRSEPRVRPTPPPPPAPLPIKTEPPPPVEPPAEVMLQPKMEYVEENDVEDLTLDDDDEEDMDLAQAGPSHAGDESSQGFFPWNTGGESNEEMYSQDTGGTQRDSQEIGNLDLSARLVECDVTTVPPVAAGCKDTSVLSTKNAGIVDMTVYNHVCKLCGRAYKDRNTLSRHINLDCGMERTHQCQLCPQRFIRKYHLKRHMQNSHGIGQELSKGLKKKPGAKESKQLKTVRFEFQTC